MKRYSTEWKLAETKKHAGWAQYHRDTRNWKWHFVRNDTEYSRGDYLTRNDCEHDNRANTRRYYTISGSFANAITINAFRSPTDRDAWVNDEPMSGTGSHYDKNREAVTCDEARNQLAKNNRMKRDHQKNSAYDECFGTTGRMEDIEITRL
jgi:hypothetical protein